MTARAAAARQILDPGQQCPEWCTEAGDHCEDRQFPADAFYAHRGRVKVPGGHLQLFYAQAFDPTKEERTIELDVDERIGLDVRNARKLAAALVLAADRLGMEAYAGRGCSRAR